MPLLRQNVFLLAATPEELKPDEAVFQVRFTKEIFRDYNEYVRRMDMYRQKIWTCKATGRGNLTYERALVSECRAAQKSDFPKNFMSPVLHMVQFSELEIDGLVEKIYTTLSDRFVVGEEVSSVKARCRVLDIVHLEEEHTDETKEKSIQYQVGWLDNDGQITEKTVEDPATFSKRSLPFTKAALKKFIQESAYGDVAGDMPWLVRDKLARKFKIPSEPPGEEKQVHTRQDPNQRQVNQAFFDESLDEIEAEYAMRKRNSKRYRDYASAKSYKSRKERKYDGCSSPNPSLDLLDDNLLEAEAPQTQRPIPCPEFKVEHDCVGILLMVWDFCNSFSKVLQLSQFSLYDFEKAILYNEAEPTLLSETYYSLFRTVLCEHGAKQRLAQRRKKKVLLSIDTWKQDLSDYMELEGPDKIKAHMQAVRENYWQLPVQAKLEILEELIERAVNTSAIRGQLEANIEEHEALCAQRRDDGLSISKRKGFRFGDAAKSRDDNLENGDTVAAEEDPVSPECSHENGCLIGWLKKGKRKSNAAPDVKREYSARCLFFNSSRQMIFRCNRVELHDASEEADGKDKNKPEDSETSLQKKMEQLDRDLEKCFVRSAPLGKDRSYNRYWFFHREGRLFVESEDSKKWGFYSGKQELDDLCCSLNPKGAREYALKEQLENAYAKITASMQKRSKDVAQRLALEEANVRRSLRVQSAPRPTGFLAYVNKCRNASG